MDTDKNIDGIEGIDPVGEQEIRGDLRDLLNTLKDNRAAAAAQLAEIDRKFDTIPQQLEAIRKETREANDALRRELQAYFVAKAEFLPHQQFVMSKFAEYDRIIAEGRSGMNSYIGLQKDVETLKKQMEKTENRGATTWMRITSITAFVVSIVAVMTQILQHVTIHP